MYALFSFEKSLVNIIADKANSPHFKNNRQEIVHNIIYDQKGARSLLSYNEELVDKVGSCLKINEEAAKQLEQDVLKKLAAKNETTVTPPNFWP